MCMYKARIAWIALLACGMASAQAKKDWKDRAEYDMYQAVDRDMASSNFPKMLTDLSAWQKQYPDSDFKYERQLLMLKGYFQTKQYAQALTQAGPLLNIDYATALSGPADAANLLLMTSIAIQQIPDPTAEQLAIGGKAARALAAYDKMPAGTKPEDWARDRAQMASTAQAALLFIALAPGIEALKQKDCSGADTAESALKRALEDHPQSAQAAALFGQAELCLYRKQPERISLVLYEYARAASLDPAQAMVDPKWQQQIEAKLEEIYRQYHSDDAEGLKQLKAASVKAALAPEGFAIKSKAELAQEAEAQFDQSHPELALWRNIKMQLTGSGGAQYFESNMKDAAIPQLLGILVEATPACRPTRLMVALSQADGPAEVELKLDKALTGAPELRGEFHFEAIAKEFSPAPFLLTMEAEPAKVEGLKMAACAPAPARRSPAKPRQ